MQFFYACFVWPFQYPPCPRAEISTQRSDCRNSNLLRLECQGCVARVRLRFATCARSSFTEPISLHPAPLPAEEPYSNVLSKPFAFIDLRTLLQPRSHRM